MRLWRANARFRRPKLAVFLLYSADTNDNQHKDPANSMADQAKPDLDAYSTFSVPAEFAPALPAFQPIVDIARGRIRGYEVLARQREADGSLSSLGHHFYQTPDATGRLLQLDRAIRAEAIDRMRALPRGFLSLNISPDWILQLNQWEQTPLMQLLSSAEVPPERIIVEITEQKGHIDALKRAVNSYRAAGYRVAIDDFGAGESHMHRIMALEPDILKLDMTLFKRAANSGQHYELLQSVSRLAEKTGCQLVCEGVETEAEFAFGLELGAAWMQGFLFAPAAADFLPDNAFADAISQLRQRFLHQRIRLQQARNEFDACVSRELMALLQQCREQSDWVNVALPDNNRILRFYLCNRTGTQISPNFEVTDASVTADPEPMGMNWCWRPHFYQLLAAGKDHADEFAGSGLYRDVATRTWCRSYVIELNRDHYLLVDVDQHGNPFLTPDQVF